MAINCCNNGKWAYKAVSPQVNQQCWSSKQYTYHCTLVPYMVTSHITWETYWGVHKCVWGFYCIADKQNSCVTLACFILSVWRLHVTIEGDLGKCSFQVRHLKMKLVSITAKCVQSASCVSTSVVLGEVSDDWTDWRKVVIIFKKSVYYWNY